MRNKGTMIEARMSANDREMSSPQVSGFASRFRIPWDLTEWIEKPQLAEWISEEVGSLDWQNPAVLAYVIKRPNYHPREMMQLLTLAYLAGVYESESIVNAARADELFRQFAADLSLTPKAIARFRRDHRALLKWALVRIMTRAIETRFGMQSPLTAGIRKELVDSATERLDLARHGDREGNGF